MCAGRVSTEALQGGERRLVIDEVVDVVVGVPTFAGLAGSSRRADPEHHVGPVDRRWRSAVGVRDQGG